MSSKASLIPSDVTLFNMDGSASDIRVAPKVAPLKINIKCVGLSFDPKPITNM